MSERAARAEPRPTLGCTAATARGGALAAMASAAALALLHWLRVMDMMVAGGGDGV